MRQFLPLVLIGLFVTCKESQKKTEYVLYKPHYDNYYGSPNLDSAHFENIQFVLNFYNEPYKVLEGNQLLISKQLNNNWELLWNFTTKANDTNWLNYQRKWVDSLQAE